MGEAVTESWLAELAELIRIPSVSSDPARAGDVRAAGQWICDFLHRAGASSELLDWNGQPLVVAHLAASRDAAHAPMVLCYGHFDVQDVEPLELWESDPFELEVRGEWASARGVADDKGNFYLLMKAAAELAAAGELPVNLRFLADGEEETLGTSVVEHLAADAEPADACVIFDTAMNARGVPAFTIGTRGMAIGQVRLRAGTHDLHSGGYGGAAMNGVHALHAMLAAVLPRDGVLPEPLRAGIVPPAAGELSQLPALATGADTLAAEQPKSIVPATASARISMRLAVGQDPEAIRAAAERLMREAAPAGATVDVEWRAATAPSLFPIDAPAVRLGLDAFERALGTRPLLQRAGGTLPIMPALAARGIPTILTGFSLPESQAHGPERADAHERLPGGDRRGEGALPGVRRPFTSAPGGELRCETRRRSRSRPAWRRCSRAV